METQPAIGFPMKNMIGSITSSNQILRFQVSNRLSDLLILQLKEKEREGSFLPVNFYPMKGISIYS